MGPLLPLAERVASLEATSKGLAEVVDKNARVLVDGLEITEARQWMIMRAMDDMVAGTVAKEFATPDSQLPTVNWEHYKELYFKFQEELRKQAAEAPAEDDGAPPADAVVFGGGG